MILPNKAIIVAYTEEEYLTLCRFIRENTPLKCNYDKKGWRDLDERPACFDLDNIEKSAREIVNMTKRWYEREIERIDSGMEDSNHVIPKEEVFRFIPVPDFIEYCMSDGSSLTPADIYVDELL